MIIKLPSSSSLTRGVESSPLKYALIGLAPYSFHWDVSKAMAGFPLFQNYKAFKDLHNFWLPLDKFENLFNKGYLNFQLPTDHLDLNNVYFEKSTSIMSWKNQFVARDRIDTWSNRAYPETVKEYTKILDDYLTLCEKNNARPIIFLPPMTQGYIKYFNKQKLNEFYYLVNEAQRKHPTAVFFDGWKLNFPDKYFRDTDHMNVYGAAKFSEILNGVIEQLESEQK